MKVYRVGRFAMALVVGSVVSGVVEPLRAQRSVASDVRSSDDAKRDALLERPVTVRLDRASLRDALRTIASSADVSIQYQEHVVTGVTKSVTLRAVKQPLRVVIDQALAETRLHAMLVGNGLTIVPVSEDTAAARGGIVGTVGDAGTKRPTEGVTVTVEGTTFVAKTDGNGGFVLVGVPAGRHTLAIRRIGYFVHRQVVVVPEQGNVTVEVSLRIMPKTLDEVVTTVTGTQRKLEVANAIGVIKADSLMKEAPVTTISQLLTGRVPGLVVSQGQGTVGGEVKLQIRGTTSLTLSSQPIVIVDGIRYTSKSTETGQIGERVSPLNDLNPNDIATVEVVKGPSAATLYGTDASNGVIVITTKRGQAGPARWNAFMTSMRNEIPRDNATNTYYGWASSFNGVPGTVQYCSLEAVASQLCTQDSVTREKSLAATKQFSVLQPDQSYGYGADVSGGQNALRYLFSATYNNQTGGIGLSPWAIRKWEEQHGTKASEQMRRPNAQTQLNLRTNVTATLSSKLEVGVGANYTRGDTRSVEFSPAPYQTSAMNNVRDSLSVFYGATSTFARSATELNNRFLLNANSQGRLTSWLTTRATAGIDMATRTEGNLLMRDTTRPMDPEGSVYEAHVEQRAMSADGGATVMFRLGRMSTRTSVGAQYVRTLNNMVGVNGYTLPPGASSVDRARDKFVRKSYGEGVTLGSYVEETIGLNERLFLTGAVRADGASTFGTGYSAVAYPKLSASWLLSEEPFLPRLSILNELRLRTAYGVSGRQPPPNTAAPSYSVTNYPSETGWGTRIVTSALGNPLLRPERGQEFETGLDAGLFNRRLQFELTWYRRQTKDLLVAKQQPAGLWYYWGNLGLVREHGAETQITATILDTRVMHWSVTGQSSSSYTKLIRLGSLRQGYYEQGGYAEGYPIGARFIVPVVGYDDANQDGFISANEVQLGNSAVYAGVARAPRTQMLNTTVGFFDERLRFSALFDRQSGNTLINDFINQCDKCRINYDPTAPQILQAYRAARDIRKVALPATRYVESGTFTRFRELTTTVLIPARIMHTLRATSGSLSLSVRNLALWSQFSGADPESALVVDGYSAGSPTGIPQSRMWVLRCNLGL